MPIITIYHNPRCSKSRQALDMLHETKYAIEVIRYLEVGLSQHDIKAVCKSLDMRPAEVVRTKEDIYQSIAKVFGHASDDEKYKIIAENPILLERPIVITHNKAIIARPPEKIKQFLNDYRCSQ